MREKATSGREGRYQLIVDALPDLLYVVDRDGRVVMINQATLNALWTLGAQTTPLGRPWREAFPHLPDETQAEIDRVFDLGEPITTACKLTMNGRSLAMECVRVPIFDDGGDVIEVANLLRDVEPHRQVEEALRRERDLVRAIFDSAPFAITVSDLDGRVIDANRRAWQEARVATLEDLLGRNTLDMLAPEERARALEGIVRTLQIGAVQGERYLLRRADGSEHPGELSAGVIREASGEPKGFVGYTRDLTEQTLLEQRLRQATQLESMGRFAGGVAQEFNDLVMAIKGYAGFVQEALGADHPASEDLEALGHAAQQAEDLVRHLIAFAREAPGAPERIEPGQRLDAFARAFRQILGPEVVAELALMPDLWPVFMAPGSFEQALVHLLVNARDRMPGGGMLVVRGENLSLRDGAPELPPGQAPGDYVKIAVADTGPDIPEALQRRLFEPFPGPMSLPSHGALGLAAVHGLATQAGGFTEARSGREQRTELSIYLPRAQGGKRRADSGEGLTLEGNETILLVEDHAPVRATAARMLRRQGYQVLEAGSAEEGLGLLDEAAPPVRLVLTDVLLPGESGVDFARRVNASHPGLPVVLMSGFAPEALLDEAARPIAVDFLHKPFSSVQLLKRIRRALGG